MIPARFSKHFGAVCLLAAAALSGGCATDNGTTAGADPTATGAAPSGNAPSDATITSAVKTALRQDELLSSAGIDVATRQGVVTLSGRVANELALLRAVSEARRVPGVKGVIPQLEY